MFLVGPQRSGRAIIARAVITRAVIARLGNLGQDLRLVHAAPGNLCTTDENGFHTPAALRWMVIARDPDRLSPAHSFAYEPATRRAVMLRTRQYTPIAQRKKSEK